MKSLWLLACLCLFSAGCASVSHEGRVENEIYFAPKGEFSLRIPNAQALRFEAEDRLVITDAKDEKSSTVSFMVPFGEIHRIDYWPRTNRALASWAPAGVDPDSVDGILESTLKFTTINTAGLKEIKITLERKATDGPEPQSAVTFVMRVESSNFHGAMARGYLVFIHDEVVYVLHYAPAGGGADQISGEQILRRLERFKQMITFRPAK